jgi:glycosyltransferase involved in cell wall biosynthesis
MIAGLKLVVVMPAFNAGRTLLRTWNEAMAVDGVDLVIVVDDHSRDDTPSIARRLPKTVLHEHHTTLGYGGNQKSCYRLALDLGADIVVMVHPDYQYTPKAIPAMAGLVASGLYHCVLGSRVLGGGALKGGMPRWRYFANRLLTAAENLLLGSHLSEFHTGYRAFSRELLAQLPLERNANDFVFDNQVLAETLWRGYSIGEVSCPTRYAEDSSSITFRRSVIYGMGCLATALTFRLCRWGLWRSPLFDTDDALPTGQWSRPWTRMRSPRLRRTAQSAESPAGRPAAARC